MSTWVEVRPGVYRRDDVTGTLVEWRTPTESPRQGDLLGVQRYELGTLPDPIPDWTPPDLMAGEV